MKDFLHLVSHLFFSPFEVWNLLKEEKLMDSDFLLDGS